ncbi:MAG: PEGA domain-containing protein [Myxococcales bacterium]|nr:PEGA domain-containing protein [Myxococcales bacterium]
MDVDELPKNRATITANVEGARVFLDGAFKCETPCSIEVPVGDEVDHELILRKDGYVEVMGKWQPRSVTERAPQLPDLKPADVQINIK